MADERDTDRGHRAPLLTEPAASQTVPILTDAIVEAAVPVLQEAGTPSATALSEETVAALREALTGIARDLTRECMEEVLLEAREELDRRLAGRFEERLSAVIERTLRDHLEPGD